MNIRKLYYLHHRFLFLKAWYFLLPAIIFALLAVHGLRGNYSTMTKLRDEVYKADQQNGDIEGALRNLRKHVYGHMNTDLASGNNAISPPIQLKAEYERLSAGEEERIKAQNAQIAARGEQTCAQKFPQAGFNAPRVACLQDYVAANSVKERTVPEQLYKFDFISPRWSPDLAGFSIVFSILFFILFIARVLLERYMLKKLEH